MEAQAEAAFRDPLKVSPDIMKLEESSLVVESLSPPPPFPLSLSPSFASVLLKHLLGPCAVPGPGH